MKDHLDSPIFLRVHTEPEDGRPARRTPRLRWRRAPVGHRLLIVVTDGEERGAHPLRCAAFRVLARRADGAYEPAAPLILSAPSEGIIVGPALSRGEEARLRAWARAHRLAALSVQDFMHDILLPEVYVEGTLGAAWDWGAFLGSVATRWGRAARSPRVWTFTLCPLRTRRRPRRSHNLSAHPYCPQVRVRAFAQPYVQHVEWTAPRRSWRWKVPHFPGRFLGLHGAVFALSADDHTVRSACGVFGVVPPGGDVDAERVEDLLPALVSRLDAEAALAQAVERELLRHADIVSREDEVRRRRHRAPRLCVCDVRTPATLAKTYLRAMGIDGPPRLDVAPGLGLSVNDVYGAAMAAFFPGEARCAIRHAPVEGFLCDVRSEYPTVAVLIGAWSWWTAARVVVDDATDDARALLADARPDEWLRPERWRDLAMLCCVSPDGDHVPARLVPPGADDDDEAVFDGPLTIPAHLGPVWYALADCLRSVFRTGRPPRILRAVRFRPEGRRSGMRGVLFGGEEPLLPDRDLFRDLVEVRHRLVRNGHPHLAQAAKVMASSLAFGVAAELHRQDRGRRVTVYDGVRRFPARPRVWERAGPFYCPPLAALVTGAGRLMLDLLERQVREAGGVCAMTATDCAFITAPDPAAVCGVVRDRLEALNPYSTVRPLLRVDESHGDPPRPLTYFGVSVNRYALYHRSAGHRPSRVVKPSGQVLGSLLDPTTRWRSHRGEGIPAWWAAAWTWGIQSVRPGHPAAGPGWLDDPAPYVVTLATPEQAGVLRRVAGGPRPFQQVLLLGSRLMGGAVAVAPLLRGPVSSLPWVNMRTGQEVRLLGEDGRPSDFIPETYRRLVSEHLRHADPRVPGGARRGRLDGAWHVRAERLGWRGKESLLPAGSDDLGALLGVEPVRYEPAGREALAPALDVLRALPRTSWPQVASRLGLSVRRLRDVLSGRASPRPWRVSRIALLADGIQRNGGSLPDGMTSPRGRDDANGRRDAGSPRPVTRKAVSE